MQTKADIPVWLLALVVGVVALLPRCLGLADFFTEDESFHWVWRVRHFAGAVRQEYWQGTNLTGHPGVTTMWLGTLGRWLADWRGVPEQGMAAGSASIAYLATLRLPLALVNTLAVVAGYLLLRRLLRPDVALLAGLMWALSPFLIAHSRLLHMDALLTSFMTLSVLCLVAGSTAPAARQHWLFTTASGLLAGLALMTKATSLALLPVVGLLLLLFSPPGNLWRRLWWVTARMLLWLACAALVPLAIWPAMWVEPWQALGGVLAEVANNGAVPHHTGNFFLGQPVADPGWLFYPVVLLWRGTPFLLIGLLLLPFALRAGAFAGQRERRVLLACGIYVALITLALSAAPKKFDRYLLPIWPALEVLAACGLIWLWDSVRCNLRPILSRYAVPAAFMLVLLLTLFVYHPYYLAYFNPLVGGGATAQRVLLVGWGEGMEHVGAWLRTRPDVDRSPVLTWGPRTLEPFIPGRTLFLTSENVNQPASYAVLYVRSMQRQEQQEAQDTLRQLPPLYTFKMHGIEYAYVYQPPHRYNQPLGAVFGDGLHLRGYSQQRIGSTLVITPSWDVQTSQPGGLFSFVHVLGPDNTTVAQVDAPIDEGLFDTWQAGQQFGSPLPLTLPPDLPPGRYQVVLGVYNPQNNTRMPLTHGAVLPQELDGPHVLPVMTFEAQAEG